jgi:hypothetical protein
MLLSCLPTFPGNYHQHLLFFFENRPDNGISEWIPNPNEPVWWITEDKLLTKDLLFVNEYKTNIPGRTEHQTFSLITWITEKLFSPDSEN